MLCLPFVIIIIIMWREPITKLQPVDIHQLVLERKRKCMKLSRQDRINTSRYFNIEKLREIENARNAPVPSFLDEPEDTENTLELIDDPDNYLFDSPDEAWEQYASLILQCPSPKCAGIINSPRQGMFCCSVPFCAVNVDGVEGSLGTEEFIDKVRQLYIDHEVNRCPCIPRPISYGRYLGIVCDRCEFQRYT